MGDLPLRTPTDRRPGGPSPRLLPNRTHPHPQPVKYLSSGYDAVAGPHAELIRLSAGCAAVGGRLDTRYSPVRRSPPGVASNPSAAPRLACVKPVASVHPEPGSNSPLYKSVSSSPHQGKTLLSQDAPSSSKCTFQIELNGSYLSTLATGLRQHPQVAAKAARLLLVLLLCLSYVILSKNDCRIAFSSAANAKVQPFHEPTKFSEVNFARKMKFFTFLDINQ